MSAILTIVSKFIYAVAITAAGAASCGAGYQPKTPDVLR